MQLLTDIDLGNRILSGHQGAAPTPCVAPAFRGVSFPCATSVPDCWSAGTTVWARPEDLARCRLPDTDADWEKERCKQMRLVRPSSQARNVYFDISISHSDLLSAWDFPRSSASTNAAQSVQKGDLP